jgi:hypothetical protein
LKSERVAQLVEHRPFKALVLGSSPSPLTIAKTNANEPIELLLWQIDSFAQS